MKVYVRRWSADCKSWTQTERELDAYNGLSYTRMQQNVGINGMELLRVTNIYLHASEPNALCVYVEEVKP